MKYDKKLLTLAMFVLMMNGCVIYHTNVIKSMAEKEMLIEDVESHQERILQVSNKKKGCRDIYENLQPGDTLDIKTPFYQELVLTPDMHVVIYVNGDSIVSRIRRKQFEVEKQKMFSDKVR